MAGHRIDSVVQPGTQDMAEAVRADYSEWAGLSLQCVCRARHCLASKLMYVMETAIDLTNCLLFIMCFTCVHMLSTSHAHESLSGHGLVWSRGCRPHSISSCH